MQRRSSITRAYDARDFDRGPSTYRDSALLQRILEQTHLQQNQGKSVADIMSGPGKVGLAVETQYPGNTVTYVDFSQVQLDRIRTEAGTVLNADVRNSLPIPPQSLDVAIVRYGIKDICRSQQHDVLRHIVCALKAGGRLIVADMFAPKRSQLWLNRQHSMKQQLSGRNINEDGECYIPTLKEWQILLENSGLKIRFMWSCTSRVCTLDWYRGKQFTGTEDEQRAAVQRMNDIILSAPRRAIQVFRIQQEGDVSIQYPVIVIAADKVYAPHSPETT